MAGLPGSNAMVSVGPPLFASGPSFGSILFRLPRAVNWQLPSELRLCPASVTQPEQLTEFVASRVLTRTQPLLLMPPAAAPPLMPARPGPPSQPAGDR